MSLFEVYPSDGVTTWNLCCDGCYKLKPSKQVKSVRVIATEFQLCSPCLTSFRRSVQSKNPKGANP